LSGLVLAIIALEQTNTLWAWDAAAVPVIRAVRTKESPVIDGKIDDNCWAQAVVFSDLTEHKMQEAAVEQTIVRLLYDDNNIYVAFECLEPEPNILLATERKDDRELWADDWIEVQLDTFHDHLSRCMFVTNPLGTRYDARVGGFGWNTSWGCDWSCACTIAKDRWLAEMAIPIGELHFQCADDVTWGINFHRGEKGRQEISSWSFHKDDSYSARWFGHLTNLDLSAVTVSGRPQLETYVSGTVETNQGTCKVRTGLDVSLRLNSRFVSAFTINPDFGQVEADTDTIELRDTERFLPERRPFFKDGAELFDTPINVYYSRRISDINAGAKITGVDRDWNLGIIDIDGEIVRDDNDTQRRPGFTPRSYFCKFAASRRLQSRRRTGLAFPFARKVRVESANTRPEG